MIHDAKNTISKILLYSVCNSYFCLCEFLSLSEITKSTIVCFSNHVSSAITVKRIVFIGGDLEGGTSKMINNIQLSMPNLLMMYFILLIPLGMHMLMMWLSFIQFITVEWNKVDKINAQVITFDKMLKLDT